MSVTHWPTDITETMVVDVELRDDTVQVRWRPDGTLEGDESVIGRLRSMPMDASDPVAVLTALRRSFGEHLQVRFEEHSLGV